MWNGILITSQELDGRISNKAVSGVEESAKSKVGQMKRTLEMMMNVECKYRFSVSMYYKFV